MRNVVIGLGLLLLALGAIAILTNMGLSQAESDGPADSVWTFDVTGAAEHPLILSGNWTFHDGTFIDPAIPPESGGSSIHVPGHWESTDHFASYHAKLAIRRPGRYAIWVDTVYTAYELYIDGVLAGSSGTVATTASESVARFTDHVFQFSVTEPKSVDLVFLVSNYYHPVSGIGVAPIFGMAGDVERLYNISIVTAITLVIIFLTAALIMLFFHGNLNKDPSILLFALFCFSLAMKVAASNTLLALFFPTLPVWFISKVEYITMPMAALSYMQYAKHVYSLEIPKPVRYLFTSLSFGYMLLILVAPIRFYYPLLMPYTILLVAMMGLVLVLFVLGCFLQKKVSGIIVFSAFVMLLSLAMQTFYYDRGVINLYLNQIAAFGMAFFVFANFHAFSLRFLQAKRDALAAADVLEEKVARRTEELHAANERLAWSASHDELTKLFNRNELIRNFMGRSFTTPLAVAYLDLDNFKMVNDHYSHAAGDIVLRIFAGHLRERARSSDFLFRVGGDEFLIVLPHTGASGCDAYAKRLFADFEGICPEIAEDLGRELSFPIAKGDPCTLTVTMGIAVQESGTVDLDTLVEAADKALLEAKAQGKDRFLIRRFPPT